MVLTAAAHLAQHPAQQLGQTAPPQSRPTLPKAQHPAQHFATQLATEDLTLEK